MEKQDVSTDVIPESMVPVALFAYNRPYHLMKTLEYLRKNVGSESTELYIFCDGARGNGDQSDVDRVHKVVMTTTGFRRIHTVFRETNYGLAKNIIAGVSDLISDYGKLIVLEDDMITSKYFLNYMNQALNMYQYDAQVASVHAYIYPAKEELPESFFLRGADCWGWGTWSRAWKVFNENGRELLDQIKHRKLEKEFNFNNSYDYLGMLEDQVSGKNNSWAVRWYASAFLKNMLTLYPGVSYIQNIGLDGSGAHCGSTTKFDTILQKKKPNLNSLPVMENQEARLIVANSLKQSQSRWQSFKAKYAGRAGISSIKPVARLILPPVLPRLYHSYRQTKYGCFGDYSSWSEASGHADGYDAKKIFDEVFESASRVRSGDSLYERDGVAFSEIQYSWPLLSGLLLAAANSNGALSVLDYGGSLGSTYYQNKKFLDRIYLDSWNIIEQDHFVESGTTTFSTKQLKFYKNIDDCLQQTSPKVLVLSSVLQYFENYEEILNDIFNKVEFAYIIIDRTPFSVEDRDIITVQRVDPKIYEGSYVCRLLSESNLNFNLTVAGYRILERFESLAKTSRYTEYGYIYERITK